MSNQTKPTLTDVVVADAAAAQALAGKMATQPSKKMTKYERAKWRNFDPDRVIAVFDKGAQAGWLATDNVSIEKGSQLEVETPPLLLSPASKLVGEGDAFKEIPKENKDPVIIQRAQAHFRAFLKAELSDEMALIYPEWREFHKEFVDKIRRACRRLIMCSFGWESSAEYGRYINRAMDAAREKITFDGKELLNDGQIKDRINKDPVLKERVRTSALEIYLKNAKYPFKEMFDKTTNEQLKPTMHDEAKVYATVDFDSGTYDNKADGPDKTTLPSDNEHLEEVQRQMLTLPGKGLIGIDARRYEPMNFVDGTLKKKPEEIKKEKEEEDKKKNKKRKKGDVEEKEEDEEKDDGGKKNKKRKKTVVEKKTVTPVVVEEKPNHFETRRTVALTDKEGKPILGEDGKQRIVTDYFYDPTREFEGRPIQSYVTIVAGLQMTASEIGGYGVKTIFKNKRQVKVIDFEDLPDRKTDDYSKRELPVKKEKTEMEEDEESSSDSDEDEESSEHKNEGGKNGGQTTTTSTSTTTATTTVSKKKDEVEEDLFGIYDIE
jgi:hypothetical protein